MHIALYSYIRLFGRVSDVCNLFLTILALMVPNFLLINDNIYKQPLFSYYDSYKN